MNGRVISRWMPVLAVAAPAGAQACAVCFGRSDSPLAEGMNSGILVLLGIILAMMAGLVLMGFVFVRRARLVAEDEADPAGAGNAVPTNRS